MMKRVWLAFVIGVLAQMLSLFWFVLAAASWPDSMAKYLGFFVLLCGSAWSVWLLRDRDKLVSIGVFLVLALFAPLGPLTVFSKAREMMNDIGHYVPMYLKGTCLALLCYLVIWALAMFLNKLTRVHCE